MIADILVDYLLAAVVVAGLAVATLLGYALGSCGAAAALRHAARYRHQACRLADEVDHLAEQLDQSEAALGRATGGTEEILTAVRRAAREEGRRG
ncbi:hypothetical protein BJF83_17495 [Nocardiopsis sp. CNR-923]|uniref:hypothetical protein n=1 Tax=Nocardiopsis sp. CNR-923 TaxID=1904965 RepID=UPI00095D308E|nr:hypothetical protein [Nocardiopsis sp. CNR-923]OLT27778.1 hypothetical protein BJF83_17495 [Nocardiopsis sp. CNR-923]